MRPISNVRKMRSPYHVDPKRTDRARAQTRERRQARAIKRGEVR